MSAWIADIGWRQPLWLLLMLQPLLLWVFLRWLQSKNQQTYADETLLPWVKVQHTKTIYQRIFSRDAAYVVAMIGFAIALAGPRVADQNQVVTSKDAFDIILVFDLSRSMQIKDTKRSRIRRATLEAYEFLSLPPTARVGAIVYAARPHLLAPLTTDFNALEFYLKDLDTLKLPTQGGDAAAAIKLANKELQNANNKETANKAIIWFTDGDIDSVEQSKIEQAVDETNIKVYILGLGIEEAQAIPLSDGRWLKDDQGKQVLSQANNDLLAKMAQKWGGVFTIAANDESDWNTLYHNGMLTQLDTLAETSSQNWKELYFWFLLPAFALLTYALLPSVKGFLAFIFISILLLISSNAMAEELFLNNMLDGATIYDSEKFGVARAKFIESVLSAVTDEQRAKALHNLGNSVFKTGDYATAIYLFSDALRYNPKQLGTMHNHKLTLELYKILQRRQQRLDLRRNMNRPNPERNAFDLAEEIAFLLQDNIHTMDFTLPEIPTDKMDEMLNQGLKHIRLVEEQQKKNALNKFKQQEINEAKMYLNALEEQAEYSSNPLWKRLFEIEEGFPALLDEPVNIPGIKPW